MGNPPPERSFDVAVIGGSAGAVEALRRILPELPAGATFPVAIVVHLEAGQPNLLPSLLAKECRVPVREASDKERLSPGTIHFAPPDYHLLLERDGSLALSVDPPVHYCRPSIDVLFQSAAESFGAGVLGIVLTGANADGADGLRQIRSAGGVAIVQDPQEAQAPELPRAALTAASPGLVLPLREIATYLRLAASPR